MKKINILKTLIFVGIFVFVNSNSSLAQWQIQNSPTVGDLQTVYFINSNVGFISGAFTGLYKTTNAGTSWSLVGNYAKDIYMFDAYNGYAAGVAGNGTMKKTTNGGATWTTLTAPSSSSIWGVFSTSQSTVFFVTTDPKVHKSTNGGSSFTSFNLTGSNNSTDIYFTDINNGYITSEGGKIWKTTNAGQTWSIIYSANGCLLKSVHFVDANNGYVAGSGGKIFKTTDAGLTWNQLNTGTSSYLFTIKFYDVNNGLSAGSGGTIIRTSNGGTTWTTEATNTTKMIYSIFYLNQTTAIAVGDSGVVLKNVNLLSNLDEKKNNDLSINFYPNPFNESTTFTISNNISISSFQNLQLILYNVYGIELKKYSIYNSNSITINRENFHTGIYFYKLFDNKEVLGTGKVIIK